MKLNFLFHRTLVIAVILSLSVKAFAQDSIPVLSDLKAMYDQANYENCLTGLEKLLATDQSPEALRLQADCYHKLGDLDDALPSYNQAIEKESKHPTALLHRGICHFGLGNLNASRQDLQACLELDPDNAMAYYYQAEIFYETFEQEAAIEQLNTAIELDNNYMEAYYLRAAASSEIGDLRQAMEDYEKAIELKPDYKRSHMNLALVHMDRGDFEVALGMLKQLTLEVVDFKNEVFYYIAEAKLSLNDKDGACEALSEAAGMGDEEAKKAYKNICEKNKKKMPKRKRNRASF